MIQAALPLLLAAAQPLSPQECADARSQMEMTACASQDYERADADLNGLWRRIIADAEASDRSPDSGHTSEDDRSEATILRTAQRAWIAFRDAQCEYEGLSERGGSMEPMIVNQCLARLIRERIAQLQGDGSNGR